MTTESPASNGNPEATRDSPYDVFGTMAIDAGPPTESPALISRAASARTSSAFLTQSFQSSAPRVVRFSAYAAIAAPARAGNGHTAAWLNWIEDFLEGNSERKSILSPVIEKLVASVAFLRR